MDDLEIRFEIVKELTLLVEYIVRGKHPFHSRVYQKMDYIMKHVKKLKGPEKEKVMESVVFCSKLQIVGIEYLEHFSDKEKEKPFDDFWRKVYEKEGGKNYFLDIIDWDKKIDKKKIIEALLEKKYPEYEYDRNLSKGKGILYKSEYLENNNILLCFSDNVRHLNMELYIGIEKPFLLRSIGSFFGMSQDVSFGYTNSKEYKKGIKKSLDLLELILPHFKERVEKVFNIWKIK